MTVQPGPYIVTHRRQPDEAPGTCVACHRPRSDHDRACSVGIVNRAKVVVLYREAFATLEDTRKRVEALLHECDPQPRPGSNIIRTAQSIKESGGRVTLPNGDVIEVEPATWEALVLATSVEQQHAHNVSLLGSSVWLDSNRTACLAAWNAEHGIGIEGQH